MGVKEADAKLKELYTTLRAAKDEEKAGLLKQIKEAKATVNAEYLKKYGVSRIGVKYAKRVDATEHLEGDTKFNALDKKLLNLGISQLVAEKIAWMNENKLHLAEHPEFMSETKRERLIRQAKNAEANKEIEELKAKLAQARAKKVGAV